MKKRVSEVARRSSLHSNAQTHTLRNHLTGHFFREMSLSMVSGVVLQGECRLCDPATTESNRCRPNSQNGLFEGGGMNRILARCGAPGHLVGGSFLAGAPRNPYPTFLAGSLQSISHFFSFFLFIFLKVRVGNGDM